MLMKYHSAVIVDMTASAILMCGLSAVLAKRHAKPRGDRRHSLDGNGEGHKQHDQGAEQAFGHRFRVYRSFWTPSHRTGSACPSRWEHPSAP